MSARARYRPWFRQGSPPVRSGYRAPLVEIAPVLPQFGRSVIEQVWSLQRDHDALVRIVEDAMYGPREKQA